MMMQGTVRGYDGLWCADIMFLSTSSKRLRKMFTESERNVEISNSLEWQKTQRDLLKEGWKKSHLVNLESWQMVHAKS